MLYLVESKTNYYTKKKECELSLCPCYDTVNLDVISVDDYSFDEHFLITINDDLSHKRNFGI